MACNICNQEGRHDRRCPNYEQPKAKHHCSICGEGIYDGEEYLVNDDGDYRHYECFYSIKDLLSWLGYEVQTMEEE